MFRASLLPGLTKQITQDQAMNKRKRIQEYYIRKQKL